jgi:hypothetical protein
MAGGGVREEGLEPRTGTWNGEPHSLPQLSGRDVVVTSVLTYITAVSAWKGTYLVHKGGEVREGALGVVLGIEPALLVLNDARRHDGPLWCELWRRRWRV